MLARNELSDVTYAEAKVGSSGRAVQRDSYAPTEPGAVGLVFPGPRMQLRTEIVAGGRRYVLKDVFVVDLSYLDEGEVFASHRSLPVHGHGSDLQAALGAFCDAFDFQWRNLVDVPEESLTAGGIRRRDAMQNAVKEVGHSNY